MPERWSGILLAIGLALAAVTGVAVFSLARSATAPPEAAAERVNVVVARADIPQLTVVAEDMLATRAFEPDLVPPRAITDATLAVGRTTIDAVPAGVVLTEKDLVEARGQTGVSLTLDAGRVLMVFPTTDPLTTAKLVQPGDRVDIQASLPAGEGATRLTQTILQNLEVLGVTGERPTLLTFIVDHQTSLVLKHLRDAEAQIDIVVRARSDTERIRTDTVDLPYLVETYGIRPTGGESR